MDNFEENIRGFKITKYSRHLFTFVGELTLPQDFHAEDLPNSGWYICFDYGLGKVEKKVFDSSIRLGRP
ncbi:hypothetical protein V2H45_17615 [Tumidithrix elongata RA019]|uniref:Uncharacterized protein n=1 Tax=Tumidithrix elongata BACA0141 TaxID=2716417 RepID=A0AAW9Q6J6_9CYAN|nr:hypothetical protein [Tumidithrix elongata RA019]